MLSEELLRDEIDEQVPSQSLPPRWDITIAVCGEHLDARRADLEQRHVEGAATQVVDQHRLCARSSLQPKGDRRGRRLVHHKKHSEEAVPAASLVACRSWWAK